VINTRSSGSELRNHMRNAAREPVGAIPPRKIESKCPVWMKTRVYFTYRIDKWDDAGQNVIEHLTGVDNFEVAEATYRAAVKR
jgi:hypothetical protein